LRTPFQANTPEHALLRAKDGKAKRRLMMQIRFQGCWIPFP